VLPAVDRRFRRFAMDQMERKIDCSWHGRTVRRERDVDTFMSEILVGADGKSYLGNLMIFSQE
jgi:hypothetical protein